jgi:hypothetical protein
MNQKTWEVVDYVPAIKNGFSLFSKFVVDTINVSPLPIQALNKYYVKALL